MDLARQRVISAVPSATIKPAHERALAALDAIAIAAVATDTAQPWWRRRACVRALEGRVPPQSARALWDRVTDASDTAEVRVATLATLTTWWTSATHPSAADLRSEALAWLRAQRFDESTYSYGVEDAIILARARLGDPTVAGLLARLTYDPWSHRGLIATQAIDALLDGGGSSPLLDAFGVTRATELTTAGPTAEARHLGLALLERDDTPHNAVLFDALHDEDIVVAERAARALLRTECDDASLLAIFDERREDLVAAATSSTPLTGRPAAACWALVTLARRRATDADASDELPTQVGPDILERLDELGPCEVPLPGVPRDVRQAVLATHLPGERTTDPRHLLEGLRLDRLELDADPQLPHQARAALIAAGLSVGEPVPIGVVRHQGSGSYDELDVEGQPLGVCTFGPFVRSEEALPARATAALEEAGFRVIDDALAGRVFDGLAVYFFGRREPLSIQDLLFYWQD